MRRTTLGSLAVAGLLTGALPTGTARGAGEDPNAGANAPSSAQSGASSAQQDLRFSGTVSAVDPTAQTVTVKAMVRSKTFHLAADAQIMVEGKSNATLGDLKVGDRVEVTYRDQDNTSVAQRISRTETK